MEEDYKKKYEELIESLKRAKETKGGYTFKSVVDEFVPELKGDEDERMWKLIKKYAHSNISDMALNADHITRDQLESWIEKKGEQKQNITNLISDLENYFATTTKEQQEKDWDELGKWEKKYFNRDSSIPVDKVETKFKVGDWIVFPNGIYWHIDAIQDSVYQVSSEFGGCAKSSLDTNIYHKFTIQDAKEGDILTTDSWTFIFKKYQYKSVYYHCAVSTFNDFSISDTGEFDSNYVHPAIKEQRDLLFQRMKEARYEWDAEKKELKKVRVSSWGEEDEKTIDEAVEYLEKYAGYVQGGNSKRYILDLASRVDSLRNKC